MRLIVFSQYFPPEVGATQTRAAAIAAGFAESGHEVEVVCEVPNHPQGVTRPGFQGRLCVRRESDGYRTTHLWVHTDPQKTVAKRLAFYASYAIGASVAGSLMRRPDLVLASSPPLPVAAAGAFAAWRHRVPWIMDIRDLWPEAAVAMGELSSPLALRMAQRLEKSLYRSAAAITVVTRPFQQAVSRQISYPPKIAVVPNGTTRFWLEGAAIQVARTELDLPDNVFLWTFAGNLGKAQGLETAIDAAESLGPGFALLILGDGPARQELESRSRAAPGAHVIFRDQVEPEIALRYLRASNALLVSLSPDPVFESFVPSKLYDFCAVGRPVVVAAAGEPRRLVEAADTGVTTPPGNSEALADALRRLNADPQECARLSMNGRLFAEHNLRDRHIERLVEIAERTVADARAARLWTRSLEP